MALMWWGKGLWQICMHNWTVHEKVDFPKFPPDTQPGQGYILHNFWSWTQKWKIYNDIFYGVSCNIKHITAIWNLYFQ